jgi:arginase
VTRLRPWVAVGAPLDCSGRSRGEEAAPAALRRAGVLASLGIEDRGDAHPLIDSSRPDPGSRLVAHRQLHAALAVLREHVAGVFADGGRPLVVGGDCSVALGALAGAREQVGGVGLAWVDGHIDAHTLATAPNAELADIVLSVLTGQDPSDLAGLAEGTQRIVQPGDVIVVGYRIPSKDEISEEELVDPRIQLVPARACRRIDAQLIGAYVASRLLAQRGSLWLHLDVDVLDESVMPAVTYPQPGGLDWDQLVELMSPMLSSPEVVGLSIADFTPNRDPDDRHVTRLSAALSDLLTTSSGARS